MTSRFIFCKEYSLHYIICSIVNIVRKKIEGAGENIIQTLRKEQVKWTILNLIDMKY